METMYDYLKAQPETLKWILANSKELVKDFTDLTNVQYPDRIYLIGCGTSFNGINVSARVMENVMGIEVTSHYSSDLPKIYGEHPMIIFVSQGGNSTNTLSAAEQLKAYNRLALVSTRACRLAEICPTMILPCGEEKSGPKTKGYTSTILTLYLMAIEAALQAGKITEEKYQTILGRLTKAFDNMPGNIEKAEKYVLAQEWIKDAQYFTVIGKGPGAATASEAALKMSETIKIPSNCYEFEEFLHGPNSLISESLCGVYLLPFKDDPDRERIYKVARYHKQKSGGRVIIVSPDTEEEDTLCLPAGGCICTGVFEWILPCQLIGALLPDQVKNGNKDLSIFSDIDKLVDVKFGHGA